jgi:hypothetical protein
MPLLVENPNANAAQREREAYQDAGKRPRGKGKIPAGKTALEITLKDPQRMWLAEYACSQYESHHQSLAGWRAKLKRFERIAEQDRSDRKNSPNPDVTDAEQTIFPHSNRSLGLVSGFADFAFAQARNDLFGTSPWFAASPEGLADEALAKAITRHAHWKFRQTSLKAAFIDALKFACDLGTGFPKITWRQEIEKYQTIKRVLLDPAGNPTLKPDGTYQTTDDLDQPIDPDAPGSPPTQEMLIEDQMTVFDNIDARCIDFNDIAFDPTAPELSLSHTDVFHRFQIGLLDAKALYGMTDEQYIQALSLLAGERAGLQTPRDNRSEATPINVLHDQDANANPPITLVEGYLRCNPFGTTGTPIRIYCVFSPLLREIFKTDYLVNQTPGGELPIYAVPWFKVPNRICGKGYFERFEDVDDFIDEQLNLVNYRDRMAANPTTGVDHSQIDEDMDETDFKLAPGKQVKLKPGAKMSDAFQHDVIPDANQRSIDLMNMMTQMGQMRTGITSASQGELAGVPENNTATGVKQIISRGATLLKWPIDEVKDSLTKPLNGAIKLLYANHNQDETFTWTEGKEPELMTLKRSDVRGITINVSLTMTQAQNQEKLQSGNAAIGIHAQYIQLPEPEKQAARPLFEQTISALGFHGADQIIRQPVTDVAGVAALLPPDIGQAFLMFAQQSGLMPAAPTEANPGATATPAPPTA